MFETGLTVGTPLFRNVRAYRCVTGIRLVNTNAVLENCEMNLSGTLVETFRANKTVTLKNCYIKCGVLLVDTFILGTISKPNYPTLKLIDSTVQGTFTDPGNVLRYQSHWILERSVLSQVTGTWLLGDITTDSLSTLEYAATSIENLIDLQPLVNAGTQTGVKRQVYQLTIDATDLTYYDTTRTATYAGVDNGDGTATITMNFNERTFGRGIRIIDAYGAGLHYTGRIVDRGATTSSPVIIAPVPTSTFSAKALHRCVFNRYPYRDPVTASLSTDGLSLGVPLGRLFYPGMVIRVSGVGNRSAYGIRTVTSVSGNVLGVDAPCLWKQPSDNTAYNPIDGSSSAFIPLPTVSISWGFPIFKRGTTGVRPRLVITRAEGGTMTISQNNATSSFTDTTHPEFTAGNRYPDHSLIGSYGGMNQALGFFETGFVGLSLGDTFTLEADIETQEQRLSFDRNPDRFYGYFPSANCQPVIRGSGYRGRL